MPSSAGSGPGGADASGRVGDALGRGARLWPRAGPARDVSARSQATREGRSHRQPRWRRIRGGGVAGRRAGRAALRPRQARRARGRLARRPQGRPGRGSRLLRQLLRQARPQHARGRALARSRRRLRPGGCLMYTKHFGLSGEPVGSEIATEQMYASAAMRELGTRLGRLIEMSGIGLITGDSGSGKSSACRARVARLHTGLYKVFYVPLSTGNPMDMYKSIAWEMGLPVERSRAALYRQIKNEVTRLATETRIRPVLILDEAQWLRSDVLEEMRLLTNYAMDSESRLCLLFCGQTELRRRVAMAVHEALSQRIVVRYQLPPLSREETAHYLSHLLRRAGTELPLFEPAAVEAIFQATGGLAPPPNPRARPTPRAAPRARRHSATPLTASQPHASRPHGPFRETPPRPSRTRARIRSRKSAGDNTTAYVHECSGVGPRMGSVIACTPRRACTSTLASMHEWAASLH